MILFGDYVGSFGIHRIWMLYSQDRLWARLKRLDGFGLRTSALASAMLLCFCGWTLAAPPDASWCAARQFRNRDRWIHGHPFERLRQGRLYEDGIEGRLATRSVPSDAIAECTERKQLDGNADQESRPWKMRSSGMNKNRMRFYERPSGSVLGCALKARGIQSFEMITAAKL